ncbi:D-2-hydroxyglutarate dehydrogenase, mitochondrial-like [Melanaphis sacchari]|uniref:D-2-hydroxyglutarate dehydrogenase, mitochondrial n=1 Tax=Melanaphis sacchari TaxID=742174 RepID=A0A2H8TDE8_9HEMI|nr:D-2-hydroxyglutarate dehydrogenase, mitochondrial-like [Melanaphis sacchari]
MYTSKPATNVGRILLHRALQFRRERSSATSSNVRVVNDVRHIRGEYGRVTDAEVHHFQSLLGEPNVLTGAQNVGPYNVDYMKHTLGNSGLVLRPKTAKDVSDILKYCNDRRIAVCPQAGNTGISSGSVALFDEVVLSTERMNSIINFDPVSGVLVCEAGCVLESLMKHVEGHGYMMPLDLGSKGSCQIGGNVSTNAGGIRVIRYGTLQGCVLGLEAVTADGTILNCLNTMRKDNTGYHLKHLFIGSEGTLGIITKVAIMCPNLPKHVNVAFIGLDSYDKVLELFSIARAEFGETLSSFELIDNTAMTSVENKLHLSCPITNVHPFYILIELASSQPTVGKHMENILEKVLNDSIISDATTTDQISTIQKIWKVRETIIEALLKIGYVYSFDISLPLNRFYEIVELTREKLKGIEDVKTVCGFGHIGDGNLHLNVVTSRYDEELTRIIEPFVYEWTSKHRGSVSAEHGIGLSKTKYLEHTKSRSAVDLMRSLKNTMDPKCILNPYKVIPAVAVGEQ